MSVNTTIVSFRTNESSLFSVGTTNRKQDDQLPVNGRNTSIAANYDSRQEHSRSENHLHTDCTRLDQYHSHHHHNEPEVALLQRISAVLSTGRSASELTSMTGTGETVGLLPPPIPPLPINYQRSDG